MRGWNRRIGNFLDAPTLIMVVGILMGIELIAGKFGRVFKALIASIKRTDLLDDDSRQIYLQDLKFAIKSTVIASLFSALIGFINLLCNVSDLSSVGPSFAVMSVSFFYGLLIAALLFALRERLKK